MTMLKFPSIGKYSVSVSTVQHHFQYQGRDENGEHIMDRNAPVPALNYRGYVKLHGTNASVVKHFGEEEFQFQSRVRILTVESDNYGFARFMTRIGKDGLEALFAQIQMISMQKDYPTDDTISIYGEWCGKGIQSGVAIADVDKMFVIFGIRIGTDEDAGGHPIGWVDMNDFADVELPDERVFNVAQFPSWDLSIDFADPKSSTEKMESLTTDVENECPVGKHFGVSGIGEGIVWVPVTSCFRNPKYWFKVKGSKHKENNKRKETEIDYERIDNINGIVDEFLNEARLERGISYLNEAGKSLDRKSTGDFVKWVSADIQKDAMEDIIAADLEPKAIGKAASKRISTWYFKHLDALVGL